MNEAELKTEKQRLIIFILTAYGISYLMGILMYFGKKSGIGLNAFPAAQMMYPACGVIIGLFVTNKGRKKLPTGFFWTVIVTTAIIFLIALISFFAPPYDIEIPGQAASISVYYLLSRYPLILGSIIAFILALVEGREKRLNAGLVRNNWGMTVWMVALFIIIYFLRTIISIMLSIATGSADTGAFYEWLGIFKMSMTWISIAVLPINYFFVFIAFFGEEYGWRYYLQPLLQRKFGMRSGVLLLGIAWGLWHLPIDLFYYSDDTGLQMLCTQIITCMAYGIFFGYAYLKTNNIWATVCIHYLNNNLIPVISGNYSADVLEHQAISWSDIPLHLLSMFIFIIFIFAKEYRRSEG